MKRFVKTKRELAECLSVSRPTLDRLFRRYPNPGMLEDGRYDVREWHDAHLSTFNRGSEESVTDD